jgi:superfamily I DNA/RNA helicase
VPAVFATFLACSESWRAGGEAVDDEPGVRILTVLAATGLKFDFVIIADAVDARFPQPPTRPTASSTTTCARARSH